MPSTNLGATGLKVPRICLGCMTYGPKAWREWVLEEAVRSLDLALGEEEIRSLSEPYRPHPVLGHT